LKALAKKILMPSPQRTMMAAPAESAPNFNIMDVGASFVAIVDWCAIISLSELG
jgi:hypothetical protein